MFLFNFEVERGGCESSPLKISKPLEGYALSQYITAAKSAFEIVKHLFERVIDVMDNIRYFFETVQDRLGYSTSRRYRLVKILGNMGYTFLLFDWRRLLVLLGCQPAFVLFDDIIIN